MRFRSIQACQVSHNIIRTMVGGNNSLPNDSVSFPHRNSKDDRCSFLQQYQTYAHQGWLIQFQYSEWAQLYNRLSLEQQSRPSYRRYCLPCYDLYELPFNLVYQVIKRVELTFSAGRNGKLLLVTSALSMHLIISTRDYYPAGRR